MKIYWLAGFSTVCLLLTQCSAREFLPHGPIVSIEKGARSLSGCSKDSIFVSASKLKKIQTSKATIKLSFGNYSCSVLNERQSLINLETKTFNGGFIWVKRVQLWNSKQFFETQLSNKNFLSKTGFSSKARAIKELEKQAQSVEERVKGLQINRNLLIVEFFEYCHSNRLSDCQGLNSTLPTHLVCENEEPQEGVQLSLTCEGETLSRCKSGPKDVLFVLPQHLEAVRESQVKMTVGFGNYSCLPVKKSLDLRSIGQQLDSREQVVVNKVELWTQKAFIEKLQQTPSFLKHTGYETVQGLIDAIEAKAQSLEQKFGFSIDRKHITVEHFDYKAFQSSVPREFTTKKGQQLSTCQSKKVSQFIIVKPLQFPDYLSGKFFIHIEGGSDNCHKVGEIISIFTEEPKDIKTEKPVARAKVIKLEVTTPFKLIFDVIQAAGLERRPEAEALAQEGAINLTFFDILTTKKGQP